MFHVHKKNASCPHGTFGSGIGATEPSISTRPAGTSTSGEPRWTGWWFPRLEDWIHTKYNKTHQNPKVVVSTISYFHPYLGKIPILTIIFFRWVVETTNQNRSIICWIFHPGPLKERVNPGWYGKLHPRKLTWNLKITCLKRKIIFQTSIVGFHVSFRGCIPSMSTITYPKLPFETALWNEGSWWWVNPAWDPFWWICVRSFPGGYISSKNEGLFRG